MSTKERRHLLACVRVRDHGMSLKEAAVHAQLSYRQMRRVFARFLGNGDAGVLHAARGRPSGRAYDTVVRDAVIARYRERYPGFGPTLAAEKLASDGFAVDHETLRRWLVDAGEHTVRRARAKHRSRRERMSRFGELLQLDGSFHRWFEERGGQECLMQLIDDATGVRDVLLCEEETTVDAMRILHRWIERYGVPVALYTDKKSVYVTNREPTIEEQLAGIEPLTEFGRACERLGIRIVAANSPQAKGRVERAHGLLQDRLVKEFRLCGTDTIEAGNAILDGGFTSAINARFSVAAAQGTDAHRPLLADESLDEILCPWVTRTVTNDFTLRCRGRVLQLTRQKGLPRPGERVEVHLRLDGTTRVMRQGTLLAHADVTGQTPAPRTVLDKTPPRSKAHTPAPGHPWNRSWHRPSATPMAAAGATAPRGHFK